LKKSSKKLLWVLVVTLSVALLTGIIGVGCQQAAAPAAAQAADADGASFYGNPDDVYHMLVFVTGVEYWIPVYEMFKEAGRQLNVKTVYSGTPEYDISKQLTVFEQVLATNPKGVYLCPMQPDPFIEPINRAIDSGIAITTFATDSPKSNRHVFVTSDNEREGIFAADALAEAIGGSGKVAVLENPGQLNHDIRIATFIQRIEDEWPNIEVVARAASNQDPDTAYSAVLTMAQNHPDLGGVFMPEANSGMGAATAAIELGGNIKVLCCDVNETILDLIKEGQLFGAINPNQGMQGYFGMVTLYVAANWEKLGVDPMNGDIDAGLNPVTLPFVDNGLTIVTEENVEYFYLDKYLEGRGSRGVEE
jgi:ribose transport system substrate-binding protein